LKEWFLKMLGIGLEIEGEEELSIWILVFQSPWVKLKLADRSVFFQGSP